MGFTETFLEKSKPAELSGFVQIAHMDRRIGEKCGCIILFAKQSFDHAIIHVGDSEKYERSLFVVRSGMCPFGLWYRRLAPGETASLHAGHEVLIIFEYDICSRINALQQTLFGFVSL